MGAGTHAFLGWLLAPGCAWRNDRSIHRGRLPRDVRSLGWFAPWAGSFGEAGDLMSSRALMNVRVGRCQFEGGSSILAAVMRVRAITVEKLFARFDHTIVLNRDEHITIVHAPNGYGKTALLRLVHALATGDVSTLREIPFHKLRVRYDDEYWVELEQVAEAEPEEPQQRQGESPEIRLSCTFGVSDDAWLTLDLPTDFGTLVRTGISILDSIDRQVGEPLDWPGKWDAVKQFEPHRAKIFMAAWLASWPVNLVSIQRLLVPRPPENVAQLARHPAPSPKGVAALVASGATEPKSRSFQSAVEVYSNEFRDKLQAVQAEYAQKSQQLERSFPGRLIAAHSTDDHSDDELQAQLAALEQRRNHLMALGLLSKDESEVDTRTAALDESTRRVLWLYTQDNREKLAVFDDLAARLGLLTELINSRFAFKELRTDPERGFWFVNVDDGSELAPGFLSSGEQHQLVMLYEFLFHMKAETLVLIDEPELSLHVSWQVEYLRDMQRIIDIAGIDVVIATHSPQIIHDRWDLTVELQAPGAAAPAELSE